VNNKIRIGDLQEAKTEEELFIDRLEGSKNLSRTFLMLYVRQIQDNFEDTTGVTVLARSVKINPDIVRRYLNIMLECKVVFKSSTSQGRGDYYRLNKVDNYYEQFIELAKEVWGIK